MNMGMCTYALQRINPDVIPPEPFGQMLKSGSYLGQPSGGGLGKPHLFQRSFPWHIPCIGWRVQVHCSFQGKFDGPILQPEPGVNCATI